MDSDSEDESFDMPPDFEEGMKFKHWCHELRIWRSSTDIQTNKHAPLIMLSCFGQNRRAKLAVSTLSKTAICSDNGVTNILDKLQDVFYDGELDFNKKEESEISTTCASISVMENNNNVVLCTQVAECQNRVLEYVTADNCTSSGFVLFQGSSSNKIFGFLAFSLELLDRFGPDFDRIIREV